MGRRGLAIALVVGCYGPHPQPGAPCASNGDCPSPLVCARSGTCELGPGAPIDARTIDAAPDAPTGPCYGGGLLTVCPVTVPTQPLAVAAGSIMDLDTGGATCTQVYQGMCVLEATTITIDGVLAGHGTRPLVLLATDSITVGGTIDVASHAIGAGTSGLIGAGADQSCTAGVAAGVCGGGYGGSFGTAGERGGTGNIAGCGAAGVPSAAIVATTVRGGCPGGNGGTTGTGGGGHGGGAVYLIAVNAITLASATIDASGSGGEGGGASMGVSTAPGGGGGGAGGLVGFYAPMVAIDALSTIFANGGGGGGGGGGTTGGTSGADPVRSSWNGSAAGGQGGSGQGIHGGSGGGGASIGAAAGVGGTNQNAGGGGGGGVGALRVFSPNASIAGQVSPAPS